jgi:hypothetical protein
MVTSGGRQNLTRRCRICYEARMEKRG